MPAVHALQVLRELEEREVIMLDGDEFYLSV
jgi:hypothetical protein